MENQNRFDPLANDSWEKAPQTGSGKNKFISVLKFVSIHINSIRGKKLELLASLTFINLRLWQFKRQKLTAPYQPPNCFRNLVHIMCTLDGDGVMLLIHKDISHMPITELENDSESV